MIVLVSKTRSGVVFRLVLKTFAAMAVDYNPWISYIYSALHY
jgi:hypothetical protein